MTSKAIVLLGFVALALAATKEVEIVPILQQELDIEPNGNFHWNYEGGDGSQASQAGTLIEADKVQQQVLTGSYKYTGPDGKLYEVNYEADQNGFRAHGDHIPTVPPLIQKSLELLASLPPQKEDQR